MKKKKEEIPTLAHGIISTSQDQGIGHQDTQDRSIIKGLIESGFEIDKASFHAAVNNGWDTPETQFSCRSLNKGRQADMWLTSAGLICRQNGVYFGTPSANVVYWKAK